MISGIAHRVGDDIDTDQILPGRYLSLTDPAEMARHVFEGADPGFADRVSPGDLLVAGRNFGGGSSREHAPLGLKALGISCVVAGSFARIFYRNAINLGLPIVVCPAAAAAVEGGERVEVDLDSGAVRVAGQRFQAGGFPPFLQELIAKGGLVAWVRDELAARAASGPGQLAASWCRKSRAFTTFASSGTGARLPCWRYRRRRAVLSRRRLEGHNGKLSQAPGSGADVLRQRVAADALRRHRRQ